MVVTPLKAFKSFQLFFLFFVRSLLFGQATLILQSLHGFFHPFPPRGLALDHTPTVCFACGLLHRVKRYAIFASVVQLDVTQITFWHFVSNYLFYPLRSIYDCGNCHWPDLTYPLTFQTKKWLYTKNLFDCQSEKQFTFS